MLLFPVAATLLLGLLLLLLLLLTASCCRLNVRFTRRHLDSRRASVAVIVDRLGGTRAERR